MRIIGLSAALFTLILSQPAASAQNYGQRSPRSEIQQGSNYLQPNPGSSYPSPPGSGQAQYAGQQPPYSQMPQTNNSSLGRLLNDVKGLVKDIVQVNVTPNGSQAVHVKAPFVDVGVNQGQGGVQVTAPFVNVNKPVNAPISVQAPLTHIQAPGIGNAGSVNVKAPFADVHSGDANDIRITAPFTNVQAGSGSTQSKVHAPFADVETGGSTPTRVQAPFTNIQTGAPSQGQLNASP